MTWDQIPLGWGDFLKFSLEVATVYFAVAPFIVFFRTESVVDAVMALLVCLPLLAASLVVMRQVEKELYEILRRTIRGEAWDHPLR